MRSTQCRFSGWQPTCATMKVVPGCAASSASSDCIRRPKLGKSPPQNDHSGFSSSSSSRSLRPSTGSKKATGSPVWMSTGSPSSPAAANTGASRSSSGSTSRPLSSRMPSPRSFQILSPRAPASRDRVRLSTRASPSKPGRPIARRSTWQNVTKRLGVGAVVAVEVALELVAPEAVQVHDRLDADLIERRDQGADVGDRPGPLGAAHELGRVERQPVVPEAEPAPEMVVRVDRGHAAAAARPCWAARAATAAASRRAQGS